MGDDQASRRSHRPDEESGESIQSDETVQVELRIGDLFKGFGSFINLLGAMTEEGKSEVTRTGEISGQGKMKGVYGFSVKLGLGGKPVVERFGNVRSTERGAEVSEVREPLVDVFNERDHILVIVEIPGVTESEIELELKDDILCLNTIGSDRKYSKEILLPALVNPDGYEQSYQNGILKVRLYKALKESDGEPS